jgi:glycosyltransferase involved in cell wall biosynthesis
MRLTSFTTIVKHFQIDQTQIFTLSQSKPAPRSLYAAFDQYPTSKGASTHIDHMVEGLAEFLPRLLLVTLKSKFSKVFGRDIDHKALRINETHFLDRVAVYQNELNEILLKEEDLILAHFRDIWSAQVILYHQDLATLFEVNALPSIELPYRFPNISKVYLRELYDLETWCLKKSQKIVCPSKVIKNHLVSRGIASDKISVVTNGASIGMMAKPKPGNYLLYFGALQPWQGIDTLLYAMKYLQDYQNLKLVICSSSKRKHAKIFQRLARKLELEEKITWKFQLSKKILNRYISGAICTISPLAECSRNIEQGCSPLKIYESLAQGTPVIASDLPVCREVSHGEGVLFFKPDRPGELALAIRKLIDHPNFRKDLSIRGKEYIRENHQWRSKAIEMASLYNEVIMDKLQPKQIKAF